MKALHAKNAHGPDYEVYTLVCVTCKMWQQSLGQTFIVMMNAVISSLYIKRHARLKRHYKGQVKDPKKACHS